MASQAPKILQGFLSDIDSWWTDTLPEPLMWKQIYDKDNVKRLMWFSGIYHALMSKPEMVWYGSHSVKSVNENELVDKSCTEGDFRNQVIKTTFSDKVTRRIPDSRVEWYENNPPDMHYINLQLNHDTRKFNFEKRNLNLDTVLISALRNDLVSYVEKDEKRHYFLNQEQRSEAKRF